MKRLSARFGTALLVLLAAFASPIRADYLNWTYTTNVTMSATNSTSVAGVSVGATDPNGGATVSLTNFAAAGAGATSIPVLVDVTSSSVTSAVDFGPGSNSPSTYNLAMTITDGATRGSGTLNFTGSLVGPMTGTTSSVVASFTPVTSDALTLDGHTYTVTIPSVTLLAPNNPQQTINATVSVSDASTGSVGVGVPTGVPEPASLLLGSLGFSCFGLGCWWKRRFTLRRQPRQRAEDA
ncbi:MAG: hypothetical protein ACRELF_08795 [Gemmataceae bacterium]